VSVVAGTYSTFLYDMVSQNKPVLLLKTVIDYGEGMVSGGFAREVSLDDDMADVIREAVNLSYDDLREIRKKLIGDGSIVLKDSIKNLLLIND